MQLSQIQTIVDELSSIYRINGDFSVHKLFPIKVSIEKIGRRLLGLYTYNPKTFEFKIYINETFEKTNPDDVVFDTIWHEMCHFFCHMHMLDVAHGKEFNRYYNLMQLREVDVFMNFKYQVKCTSCGQESGMFRLHTNKYRMCTECGCHTLDIRKLR